jgi:hypothetical protein
MDTVNGQLKNQPTSETRIGKPMRPNPVALWELRTGNYEIEEEPARTAGVLAVGVKEGNQVQIGER